MKLLKVFTREVIEEGGTIPKWYGLAYVDWDTDSIVCYPIPLNWIICYADKFVIWLKRPPIDNSFRLALNERTKYEFARRNEAYQSGLKNGYKEGYDLGKIDGAEECCQRIMKDIETRLNIKK